MPQHAGRINAKPPPGRDVERKPPEPSPRATDSKDALPVEQHVVTKVKTKAEKLYEMHLRKLRSLAKPLDPSQQGSEERERRFFEWGTEQRGQGAEAWEKEGKVEGKLERVWVMAVSLQFTMKRYDPTDLSRKRLGGR